MKVLITGASGQLGRSLQRTFAGDVVVALSHADLDITDGAAVTVAMRAASPDAVIHCAALTDTVRCEKEPALARAINGIGSEHVAQACRSAGARLIAISTNEVFAGTQREPYIESDATGPLNAYALSKLDGEVLAAAACPDTLIVRVSWLYGDGYMNFNEKVIAAAKEGRALSFVTDEVATPTSTEDVATAVRALLDQYAPPGIYHLANQGEASRYDWAIEILRLAGMADVPVAAVTTSELRANGYAGPVKPPCSALANTRAAAFGITLPPWRDALAAYFERARKTADA
jgi:dTDP-4-dehydrorhamnose reductase